MRIVSGGESDGFYVIIKETSGKFCQHGHVQKNKIEWTVTLSE